MPQIQVHPPSRSNPKNSANPLPSLLHTPQGLAVLEIQGRLNIISEENDAGVEGDTNTAAFVTEIGRIEFPLLSSSADDTTTSENGMQNGDIEGQWSKKVHLYIGKNQRLVGEIKRLAKPLAVVRRKMDVSTDDSRATCSIEDMDIDSGPVARNSTDDLEIVDIVKWKLFFGGRPEFV